MKIFKLSLAFIFTFSAPYLWADNTVLTSAAQTAMQQAVTEQQSQNATTQQSAIPQQSAVTTTTTTSSSSSNVVKEDTTSAPTINQAADTGRRSQNSGAMMNMIASAGLFAACLASCPKCRMELCAMGAMAAAQAANQGQAANMSDMTFDASEFNPGTYNPYDGSNGSNLGPASGSGNISYNNPVIKEGMGRLTESGYTVSSDGLTYPDGSFVSSSAFSSPDAMIAAGIDPSTAHAAGDVLGAVNSELEKLSGASVAAMGVNSAPGGGGGGGAAGSVDFGDMDSFSLPSLGNPFAKSAEDKKKIVAGKTMMVGGEPIGVKGDNIFDMVHRAYQKKRGKQMFNETSAVPARLPASTTKGNNL